MTTVLNRKFDLLCHSGTCPSYLIDVLSLLVAHANDTELFKSELRTSGGCNGGGDSSALDVPARTGLFSSRGTSATRPDRASREVNERSAADRRADLMYRQVEDPEALDDALRASHESVLIAAEQSLQTYAEDLKHMNEIAMATSAKQLRTMRVETQTQMEAFRDRVCASVVTQTRDELEVMRSEFGAAVKEDASAMVRQLHEVSLAAQRQVQELTNSYAEFVAETHAATVTLPLADAHDALTAVEFVQERVDSVAAAAASHADLEALETRLRELEKVVATLGSAVSAPPATADGSSLARLTPVPQPPLATTVATADMSSTLASSLSLNNGQGSTPQPGAPALSRAQTSARPAAGKTEQNSTNKSSGTGRGKQQTAAPSPPPPPVPQPPASAPTTCAERLGVVVESAEEGVVLTQVLLNSIAANHQLGAGHIISHVGRVAVTSPASFEAALQASEGQALKLTTYDPFQGRIRVLTIQPSSQVS